MLQTNVLGLFLLAAVTSAANTDSAPNITNVLYEAAADHLRREYKVPECSTTCHEVNCDGVGIRYGKYCGVGHGGCPGEEPCDEVDGCCKEHDECVEMASWGVLSNQCHEDLIACLDQQMLAGTKGFSRKCPYSTVITTMRSAIELVMLLGDSQGGLAQLWEDSSKAQQKGTQRRKKHKQKKRRST